MTSKTIYPKTSISYQRVTVSSTLIAALFTIAKKEKQSKCDIFTVEYYMNIKKN